MVKTILEDAKNPGVLTGIQGMDQASLAGQSLEWTWCYLPPNTVTNFSNRYRICLMYIKFLAFRRFLRRHRWISSGSTPQATSLQVPQTEAFLSSVFQSRTPVKKAWPWPRASVASCGVPSTLGPCGVHTIMNRRGTAR